ncbi:hypothetical protein QE152_g15340 [Popillia japonica]|uniref:Reverse transcriptase domain-containing protein n=1 Tax=Popillia japonica TaxID=7064 RepID=A0AAW1L9E6_POPJA
MDNRLQVDAVYSDFSKAFDKVNLPLLVKKLNYYGVAGNVLSLFQSYLVGRWWIEEQRNDVTDQVGLENEAANENQVVKITSNTKAYTLKTTPGKRRFRNEKCWKSTVAKENRNLGKEYVSRKSKKVIKAREINENCKEKKCKLYCFEKISEEQRHHIFNKFWSFGDHNRYYDFLAKHVKISQKKVCTYCRK